VRFVITGLPRSRSAWFAAYFSEGDSICVHEASLNGWPDTSHPDQGTADCSYILLKEWFESIGEHKLIIIHRNIFEVEDSLKRIGTLVSDLYGMAESLNALDGLHVNYNDINDRLEDIHGYLGLPFDRTRAELFKTLNIQSEKYR